MTSASSPTALYLARLLSTHGHTVYGAGTENVWATAPARYSRTYTRFFRLQNSRNVVDVVRKFGVMDVVIPVGDQVLRREEMERMNKGQGRELKVLWYEGFGDRGIFQDFVRERVLYSFDDYNPNTQEDHTHHAWRVVKLPLSFDVNSHADLERILNHYPDTRFELQLAPYNDDEDTLVDLPPFSEHDSYLNVENEPVLICKNKLDSQTISAIEDLPISNSRTYRLTEATLQGITYEAHSLVNGGSIQTFTVTTPTEDSFTIVPPTVPIVSILHAFVERFVHMYQLYTGEQGLDNDPFSDQAPKAITGHITLRFIVQMEISRVELVERIMVTECSNKIHPSVMLLATSPEKRRQLVKAYTAPTENWQLPILMPENTPIPRGVYKMQDVVREVCDTLKGMELRKWEWWRRVAQTVMMLWVWGCCFREEIWDVRDPGPAVVEWVVKGPVEKGISWLQGKKKAYSFYERVCTEVGWLLKRVRSRRRLADGI
jgi:hypothetical protein